MSRFSTVLFSGLFALMVAVPGHNAWARTLRMSAMPPTVNIECKLLQDVFIPYIEKESKGRYKIDLYPGMTLGNTETIVQGLVMGTIDLALDSAGNLDQFCPTLALLDLPYLFDREDIARLNASPVGAKLRKAGEKTGLHIIDLNCWFPRNLISRVPLHTMEDLQGLKNRTTGSKWQMLGVSVMGLKPIPIPATEMLTAIQQGMVDSMDISIPAMQGFRVIDVAKYVTITNQAQIMGAFVCSSEFWADLPDEDKAIFEEAAHRYSSALDEAVATQSDQLMEELKAAGGEVYVMSEEENAKLRKLAEENLSKNLSAEENALLNEIRTAVK